MEAVFAVWAAALTTAKLLSRLLSYLRTGSIADGVFARDLESARCKLHRVHVSARKIMLGSRWLGIVAWELQRDDKCLLTHQACLSIRQLRFYVIHDFDSSPFKVFDRESVNSAALAGTVPLLLLFPLGE